MTTALVLGIDIGGTKTAVGLVDSSGRVTTRAETSTPAREGGAHIVAAAARLGRQLVDTLDDPSRVLAVGVGSAGVIDPRGGHVLSATDHLSDWAGTELTQKLRADFGLPVTACNDVHAHAMGEAFAGAGRGHDIVLLAAVGTGIGGAVVLGGRPELGTHGVAGHLGHVPVAEASGLLCPCGKRGHVEGLSSGTALFELYRRNGGDPTVPDTRAVVARTSTDLIAHASVVTSARAFGHALGGVANMVDPGIVILAGGMINAGALWWDSMVSGVRESVIPFLDNIHIVRAQLGDDAAIVGAAKRAFDEFGAHV